MFNKFFMKSITTWWESMSPTDKNKQRMHAKEKGNKNM